MRSTLSNQHSFQRAGSSLESVLAGSLRHVARELAPVLAWPLACGSAVAARTRAIDFSKSILRVEVADAGWKRELEALAPRYLASINRYVSSNVSRIEFVVKNLTRPEPTR